MERWQKILQNCICNGKDLARYFPVDIQEIDHVAKVFPFRIPVRILDLMKDQGDPIYRQCVPDPAELAPDSSLMDDPLGEERHKAITHVVKKYPDRCLFLISNQCAMYCRFCTRKRKFRQDFTITQKQIDEGIEWIREHTEIHDVLLSGGDPLLLEDQKLQYILEKIHAIEHVRFIRIGSRAPVVLPERITRKLTAMLKKFHPLYINIHCNHPAELTPDVVESLRRLADAGIPLGSQTVLLKGVNDNVETMRSLMYALLEARVKPYYIFLSDLIYGTEHFRTSIDKGLEIIEGLRGHISGMGVPHLVIDLPGGGGKITLVPDHLRKRSGKNYTFCNYLGEEYLYPDV
ncbi:MAG: KamA family radical SAM protein [Lentisphaeria bacterium]|nr:KamA family radical SAM protein [Lentisphaeria bacterium]